MCKISVIVPVYNIDQYLDRCVSSIISQSCFEQLEVILVNDGSTDKSPDKCQEYAKKYSNIVVINKDNGGVSSARNAGISAAHGQYIAFVDGDDYVATDFFQEMLDAIIYSQSDLVIFDYYVVYNRDSKKAYRGEIQENYFTSDGAMREFLKGGAIGINLFDKLYVTRIVKQIAFDPSIRIGEDLYFIFQYLQKIEKCYGVYKPGYYYVQREGSAMKSQFAEKNFDAIIVAERIMLWAKKNHLEYMELAEAHYIHVAYKTVERALKSRDYAAYKEQIDDLYCKIKHYRLRQAYNNLSRKQFVGFLLMKLSPKAYILVCKVMKI